MIQATPIDQLTLGERIQQGLRTIALWSQIAVAGYFLLSLVFYHPEDPGWSHLGFQAQIQNLGGAWGAWFADLSLALFGYPAFLFPIAVSWSAYLLFGGKWTLPEIRMQRFILCWIGFLSVLVAASTLADLFRDHLPTSLPNGPGGGFGQLLHHQLNQLREIHRFLVFLIPLAIGLPLFLGLSWLTAVDLLGGLVLSLGRLFSRPKPKAPAPKDQEPRLESPSASQENRREPIPEPLKSPLEFGVLHDPSIRSETHPTRSDTQPT